MTPRDICQHELRHVFAGAVGLNMLGTREQYEAAEVFVCVGLWIGMQD